MNVYVGGWGEGNLGGLEHRVWKPPKKVLPLFKILHPVQKLQGSFCMCIEVQNEKVNLSS